MHKRTKYLQYDKATAEKVIRRQNHECIFCRMGYRIAHRNMSSLGFNVYDIAHFIGKGQGGLGIEENLVLLCRYHHTKYDNGNNGWREEMEAIMEEYLKSQYKDWSRDKLIYRKSDFL